MSVELSNRIATELSVNIQQVTAAIELLDGGATVPFIARYRKELTGALDDTQLRKLEERLHYLRELEERRAVILKSIADQDKLTPGLEKQITEADTKTLLEDLYLPYKPKRRTKAQIAREAGLEPLADALLADPSQAPETLAEAYIDSEKQVGDVKTVLEGAKQILMERFSEDAKLLEKLRHFLREHAYLHSSLIADKKEQAIKYSDYFDHREPLNNVPSHRALAMFRGRNEGVLSMTLTLEEDLPLGTPHPAEIMVAEYWQIEHLGRQADDWLAEVVRWTWRVKLLTKLETDLLGDLRERAEEDAITVFAKNIKDLLLAAPAGQKATIGLDPGLRTGVKVAVVDATSKLLEYATIYPTPPQNKIAEAEACLVKFCKQYDVELIAIGNGTASRETDKFVGDMLKKHSELKAQKVIVNESGASIYSASEFASQEFPNLDVTIRGAVSIARRLQDPLAELVKIDPKAIGVGQYQHDVSQTKLAKSLDAVVEDCVNGVGVELNSASAPLLARVAGLNNTIANNIIAFRDQNGAFKNRSQLKKVARLGDKAFEQAAGFLRISEGENPLDASGVHPESYTVVHAIATKQQREIKTLIGDTSLLRSLNAADYTDGTFGIPTITDILQELDKPGRDPRPEFKTARFQEGVEQIKDLEQGMILEGTITNVTNFGAFVDIGVHQDGLVHISALSHNFVKDPHSVAKAGDIVKVKVMDVDVARKRIALSMRLDDEPEQADGPRGQTKTRDGGRKNMPNSNKARRINQQQSKANKVGSMGSLLTAALEKSKR